MKKEKLLKKVKKSRNSKLFSKNKYDSIVVFITFFLT